MHCQVLELGGDQLHQLIVGQALVDDHHLGGELEEGKVLQLVVGQALNHLHQLGQGHVQQHIVGKAQDLVHLEVGGLAEGKGHQQG